ncbi:HoxN/HupN/NixA family nickel/cobalt transporter [Catenuloplanes japonicus]|uniref:HoxN/HupN/NixA family nickel/cobalt transporter n=1 Tax=Catenuloplanes japonicus TaxID=33876 RepID=UPI0005268960|nr:hypothetical protein [Catenuloplanes japonicus]
MNLADRLQDLIHTPGVAPLAFVFAFLAGAGHALAPGHGKTLAAAYLAGSRGRIRDAAWLGGSVAVMHTVSVLVIGVAWTFFPLSALMRMEQLTSWLQIVAGLLVLATGLWMLRRHLRGGHRHHHHHGHSHGHGEPGTGAAAHDHGGGAGDGHDHGRGAGHLHDHGDAAGRDPHGAGHVHVHGGAAAEGHHHAAASAEGGALLVRTPVDDAAGAVDHAHDDDHGHHHHHHGDAKRPGLFLLGISGGLTPSPAAFLVLATGLFLGRGGFALLLVLTFGIGMAVVLFGVGVLAVAGSNLVARNARSRSTLTVVSRVTPLLAAGGITVFGIGMIVVAATQLATMP